MSNKVWFNGTWRDAATLAVGGARLGAPVTSWVFGTAVAEVVAGSDAGADELSGRGGIDTLVGGGGDDRYQLGYGTETVLELPGGGVDTVVVWHRLPFALPSNVENLVLAVTGDVALMGNAEANWLIGNDGRNVIQGRGGGDVLEGRGGADVFSFIGDGGHDIILDFRPGEDVVRVGAGTSSWWTLRAGMRDTADGVRVDLGGGDFVTLAGVKVASLSSRDFQLPLDRSRLILSFSEEFDGDGLRRLGSEADGGGWRGRMFHGTGQTNGDEAQYYVTPGWRGRGIEPVSVSDGVMRIEALHRPDLAALTGGHEWLSGVVTTEGTFAQRFGLFEARVKLEPGSGLFPAFWLLPADASATPELDVFEWVSKRPDETFHMGYYNKAFGDPWGWHTYGLEWTAERIAFYVDGVMVETRRTLDVDARLAAAEGPGMYMVLNMAVGGGWAGAPDASTVHDGVLGGMDVDWVRTWRLPGSAAPSASAAPLLQIGPHGDAAFTFSPTSTGRLTFTPDDMNLFDVLPVWSRLLSVADRAADAYSFTEQNGWGHIPELRMTDRDGGTFTLTDLAVVDLTLGGTKASTVTLIRPQAADVTTGAGNDIVRVLEARRWLVDQDHDVTIRTGAGHDRIEGWTKVSGSILVADGGIGHDTIIGSADNDVLIGGRGSDRLTGGEGFDQFVFRRGEDGHDVIADFHPGQDILVLEGIVRSEVSVRDVVEGTRLGLPGGWTVTIEGLPKASFDWAFVHFG